MDWVNDLVAQHKKFESPTSFWRWAFIAAISAVVKDNIWIDRIGTGAINIYPNIYVMLHAESGLKKGPPINAAKKLVTKVGNNQVIYGRGSIQGMLKKVANGYTQPGGKVVGGSTAFICSSELTSSLVEDKTAIKLLTDLYDRNYNEGDWESNLKLENFTLKSPTITMLSATNEAMSEDFINKAAIQGGYIARTFIIYEKENAVTNSLIFPFRESPNYDVAANYLVQLSKLRGRFAPLASFDETDIYNRRVKKFGEEVWFSEAGLIYDEWYEDFCKQRRETDFKDETGTLNRFGDSVLKVAMLLSLSKKPELIISPMAMHEAIEECEKLLGNARKTTMGKHGISNTAQFKHMIIMELLTRETHQISADVLLKKCWMHYNSLEEFNDMMLSFDHSGLIKTSSIGNKVVYTMPEDQVQELKQFFAGRNKKK